MQSQIYLGSIVYLCFSWNLFQENQAAKEQVWIYSQSTGKLTRDGKDVATGYSGYDKGRNNPDKDDEANVGPIPRGDYRIAKPRDSKNTGPFVLDLSPVGHKAHGRSALQIHGDNKTNDASKGCIILPLQIRKQISAGPSLLRVGR